MDEMVSKRIKEITKDLPSTPHDTKVRERLCLPPHEDLKRLIFESHDKGYSISAISKKTGASQDYVRKLLDKVEGWGVV